MDTPPSASIHEEATVSVVVPFMALFNNLVIFDQHVARNSFELDRARSRHELDVERRRQAARFQAAPGRASGTTASRSPPEDVACTFDLLLSADKLRRNPRAAWWSNVEKVTADGDFDVTFHLKHRQPALLALLASGYTPIYPCHVPDRGHAPQADRHRARSSSSSSR